MFVRLEGDTAILASGGVYKVADLYERDGKLFAAAAGGYVRIYASGATSKDKLRVDTLAIEEQLFVDRLGRLCVSAGNGRSVLPDDQAQTLMISKD